MLHTARIIATKRSVRPLASLTTARRFLQATSFRHEEKTIKIANQTVPAEAPADASSQSTMDLFVNMFDRGPNVGVEVITKDGFVLSNNVQIRNPLVLLNGSAFLWQVPQDAFQFDKPISLDAFKIFEVASPKPELVLLGTGKNFTPIPPSIREYFYKLGIQVDQMNTKHAAATYNVLAEEGRRVAAALLPVESKQ
ncbi:hypothetical protein O0I10_007130 [Lichtheimia ornata]|uniref:NADH dehydrogenase [ubiquinone] 1 alpha subcomplex assembly factor 3 n=1 Tax=Lichtheimia ornata TaxID=688661 RepID=A0AAD7XY16_9FUNG|nr:uncharacterized protein O0I10_007130 [Lichtheimia ornata]KAJ8657051.1 hypothetical protein O0I10_007130 [Lichtheimia ornata]